MADLLNEIYETVKTIDSKVGQLLLWRASHTAGHESIKRDIDEVRGCLFSKSGLTSQVQNLQGCKEGIKSRAQVRRQFIYNTLSKLVAAGVIALMTWFIIRLSKGQ